MFGFELNDQIKIKASKETGIITGRAEYTNAEPSYRIFYCAGDGRAVEGWWSESQIEHATSA